MTFVRLWLPVLLWAALILSAANDQFSDSNTAGWLERLLGRIPPEVNVIMRKSAHVAEYAVLALLSWRARKTWGIPLLICLAVAVADESMQAMTANRTGSIADVGLDMCGAVLALLCLPSARAKLLALRRRR
jgi:VanZ family protein